MKSVRQNIHLEILNRRRNAEFNKRFKNAINYDLKFYEFKCGGKINISKMSRCTGISRGVLSRELYKRGVL